MTFGVEKLEWYGQPTVKIEDKFISFDRIYKRDGHTDRRTDGRTPHDSIGRTCIASRVNKNQSVQNLCA